MRRLAQLGLVLSALLASACSTIYVANVKFTAPEICSEELASRLHPNSGCLPPTRTANIQRLYLARFRPQIAPSQTKALDAAAEDGAEQRNFLPSLLGRVFVAAPDPESGGVAAPRDGNLEFLPLGDVQGQKEPERNLKVEVNLRTDIRGAADRQSGAGLAVDPAAIVEQALQAAGIPAGAATQSLRAALTAKVAAVSYSAHALDSGVGSFMYVTLTATELDSLNQLLAVCGLTVPDQEAGESTQRVGLLDRLSVKAGADAGPAPAASAMSPACARALADPRWRQSTKDFVVALREAAAWRPEVLRAGVVVGVAVLRTRGKSQLCRETDLGLVASGQKPPETGSCAALKDVLDTEKRSAITESTAGAAVWTDAQEAGLLQSISAQLAEKTYKDQDLYEHASVLALHWIPLRLGR